MTNGDDHWFGDSSIGERFPAWTRGNAADVFPDPVSPLAQWMVVRNGMCRGLRDGYIDIGALDYDEFENPDLPDLFHMFGGYLYNPLSLTRLLGARMPGVTPELIDQAFFDEKDEVPPYEPQDWHESPEHEARLGASMEWAMSVEHLPELDADKALARSLRAQRPDLTELTDAALLARARAMISYIQQVFENAMRVSSLASVGSGALGAVCEAVGRPGDTISLLAGIEVDSAEPSKAMWQLGRTIAASDVLTAAFDDGVAGVLDRLRSDGGDDADGFLADFEQFLFDYGARASNEYDLDLAVVGGPTVDRPDRASISCGGPIRTRPPQRATRRRSPNATASSARSARRSPTTPRHSACSRPRSDRRGVFLGGASVPRPTWSS